jgi:hypothetical protein
MANSIGKAVHGGWHIALNGRYVVGNNYFCSSQIEISK